MAEELGIHIIGKSDFVGRRWPASWSDEDHLLEFPGHMRRMIGDNPLSSRDDDPAAAVVTIGDAVAGRINLMPGELRVRGEGVPAMWGFSLIVSPRFRGKGIATRAVEGWRDAWDTAIGNSINAMSAPIYPKTGWDLFETPRMQLILRSRKFVDGFAKVPLAGPLSSVLDVGLGAWRGLAGFSRESLLRGLRAEHIPRMDPEHDQALERQRALVMHHRSAAWINWMLECPEPEERDRYRLYLVRDSDERVAGYFMLSLRRAEVLGGRFRQVAVGYLKEWGVFDGDREQTDAFATVLLALRELLGWGADVVILTTGGLPEDALRGLRRLGFRPREQQRMSFISHPGSPLIDEEYHRQENWYLTEIDSDGLFL